MKYSYKTTNTCCKEIEFEINKNVIIQSENITFFHFIITFMITFFNTLFSGLLSLSVF